jgi:hypothetical protein
MLARLRAMLCLASRGAAFWRLSAWFNARPLTCPLFHRYGRKTPQDSQARSFANCIVKASFSWIKDAAQRLRLLICQERTSNLSTLCRGVVQQHQELLTKCIINLLTRSDYLRR